MTGPRVVGGPGTLKVEAPAKSLRSYRDSGVCRTGTLGTVRGMDESIGDEILEQLRELSKVVRRLERKVDRMASTEAELAGKLDDIEKEVTGLQATVADFQVGAPVTQKQLDDLNAHADKILGHQAAAADASGGGGAAGSDKGKGASS